MRVVSAIPWRKIFKKKIQGLYLLALYGGPCLIRIICMKICNDHSRVFILEDVYLVSSIADARHADHASGVRAENA